MRLLALTLLVALLFLIGGKADSAETSQLWLVRSFHCIYRYENGGYGWRANTGNGYYGGLQMDRDFMATWGPEFYRRWGTANRWPREVQLTVAIRAYFHRGFQPWPTTSRWCGLR